MLPPEDSKCSPSGPPLTMFILHCPNYYNAHASSAYMHMQIESQPTDKHQQFKKHIDDPDNARAGNGDNGDGFGKECVRKFLLVDAAFWFLWPCINVTNESVT